MMQAVRKTATQSRPSQLSRRDRRLLWICGGVILALVLAVAFFAPNEDDDSRVPSSFASGSHGAKAAYLLLEQSGYRMERWEQPLGELAAHADAHTVVILAQPGFTQVQESQAAVQQILARGGRVIATGIAGAVLLPNSHAGPNQFAVESACEGKPVGFDALASSGIVRMRPLAQWTMERPEQHAQYTCAGDAVVVSYAYGPGTVVWWADSLPLENAGIARDGNLALLLNSIGPRDGTRVVWDESLHEDVRGVWSYAQGTPVKLLWAQLALLAVLLLWSYSRRSGPLVADPVTPRDTPMEFAQSLGALYEKAGATDTVVKVAYDRLRLSLGRPRAEAAEIAALVRARGGETLDDDVEPTIAACETGATVSVKRALELVRRLAEYTARTRR